MNALVSGQAGIAALITGNSASLLDIESEGQERRVSTSTLPYYFAGAHDVVEIKSTTLQDARALLYQSWECDRAFRLFLISLDREEDIHLRHEAVNLLSGLLSRNKVAGFVLNQFFSIPLPQELDPEFTLVVAKASDAVRQLIDEILSSQSVIRKYRQAWESIPSKLFEDSSVRIRYDSKARRSGVFRDFVRGDSNPKEFQKALFRWYREMESLPRYREIVEAWIQDIKPSLTVSRVIEKGEEADQELREPSPSNRKQSVHELFENIKKQKEGIVESIKRNELDKGRMFIRQLVSFQQRTGPPEFIAKSLCDLAKQAKALANFSFQLELATWAVDVCPTDAWSHSQVADAYFCLNQFDNALRWYDKGAGLGMGELKLLGYARIMRAKGNLEEALKTYEKAIVHFPEILSCWLGYAETQRDMLRYQDALQTYQVAIEMFPNDEIPLCGKAAIFKDLGRFEEALALYDHVIMYYGKTSVPYGGLADVLKVMGKLDEALTAYDHAIFLFPDDVVPKSGRADVLKEMGKLQESLDSYVKIVQEYPNEVVPWTGRADVLRDMGRFPRALDAYETASSRFPHESRIFVGRAAALRRMGRPKESLQAFDDCVSRFPYDLNSLNGRANLLKQLGHAEDAVKAYDQVLEKDPHSKTAMHMKASALATMGKFDEAMSLLPSDRPRTRDEWIAYHVRAMILLRNGRLEQAIECFRIGISDNPFANDRRYFRNALAVATLRKNKSGDVLALLSEDLDPMTRVLKIHASGAVNRLDIARRAYSNLKLVCPPVLIDLRDELAAQYSIVDAKPRHSGDWVFEEECKGLFLLAA